MSGSQRRGGGAGGDRRGRDDRRGQGEKSQYIERVVAIGPIAQVELTQQDGPLLEVAVSRDVLHQLGLSEGDAVTLRPRKVRLFETLAA